jgi:hypothetical protein
MVIYDERGFSMKCVVCGVESENRYCGRCGRVMADIVNTVGEERWNKIDDCAYIYPSVLRVARGELTVTDIVQFLEEED